jgi:hypothetical protein
MRKPKQSAFERQFLEDLGEALLERVIISKEENEEHKKHLLEKYRVGKRNSRIVQTNDIRRAQQPWQSL